MYQTLSEGENVKVMMPTAIYPSYPPYWKWNEETRELEGYFVDLLQELFRSADLNYTLLSKIDEEHFEDYSKLGKFCGLHGGHKILAISIFGA